MMYFVLSKVAWLLLQPSTLLFAATLIGALLLATPLAQFGRRLALVAGSLLAICALTPLCVVIVRPLENRFPARPLDAVDVAPHPVDYLTLGTLKDYWDYTFSPVAALQLLDAAAKEWVGLAIYRLSGKTADFLPKAKQ
jgi:uncharacterized SAM-binding protein YcdF (DUF218 family)